MPPPHPKRYVHVLTLELVNVTLFGKRVFSDVIKDLDMRSSWIIWMGPNSSDKCPYKRQKRRDSPGGPVVGTPSLSLPRARVQSLVGELRSHKLPCGQNK